MRTTTMFLVGRRRLVLALLALSRGVGGVALTGQLGADEVMPVGVDGGSVGNGR